MSRDDDENRFWREESERQKARADAAQASFVAAEERAVKAEQKLRLIGLELDDAKARLQTHEGLRHAREAIYKNALTEIRSVSADRDRLAAENAKLREESAMRERMWRKEWAHYFRCRAEKSRRNAGVRITAKDSWLDVAAGELACAMMIGGTDPIDILLMALNEPESKEPHFTLEEIRRAQELSRRKDSTPEGEAKRES